MLLLVCVCVVDRKTNIAFHWSTLFFLSFSYFQINYVLITQVSWKLIVFLWEASWIIIIHLLPLSMYLSYSLSPSSSIGTQLMNIKKDSVVLMTSSLYLTSIRPFSVSLCLCLHHSSLHYCCLVLSNVMKGQGNLRCPLSLWNLFKIQATIYVLKVIPYPFKVAFNVCSETDNVFHRLSVMPLAAIFDATAPACIHSTHCTIGCSELWHSHYFALQWIRTWRICTI